MSVSPTSGSSHPPLARQVEHRRGGGDRSARSPAVPPLHVLGPGGVRITVRLTGADDRVGDLADALGIDPAHAVAVDGRGVERAQRLVDAGLVHGSQIASRPLADDPGTAVAPALAQPMPEPPPEPAAVVLAVDAGPDAGRWFPLPPGRSVVGRSTSAAVAIADPWIEAHHGVLDVAPDGTVTFTQLAGRTSATLGGEPFGGDPIDGPVELPLGTRVVIGSSLLSLRAVRPDPAPVTLAATPGDPWRRTVRRAPRRFAAWQPDPLVVPGAVASTRPASGSIVGALLSLVGSVTLALIVGQPMFMLFGVLGAVVSLGTWAVARLGGARQGRRAARRRRAEVADFLLGLDERRRDRRAFEATAVGTVGEAVAVVAADRVAASLWERRPGHGDELFAALGWGDGSWRVPVVAAVGEDRPAELPPDLVGPVERAAHLDDVPVTVGLGAGAAVAVRGAVAPDVARSVVVQLAVTCGPADWRLVVVTDDVESWAWVAWLPHAGGDDGGAPAVVDAADAVAVAEVLVRLDDGLDRHTVVVTDRPDLLASRTGSLRRFLSGTSAGGAGRSPGPTSACLVIVRPDDTVPAMCRSVLEVGSLAIGRWYDDASSALAPRRVHVAGISIDTAREVARRLAAFADPERHGDGAELVGDLRLGALVEGLDCPDTIVARWRAGGVDPAPATPIGLTADGVVELDLVRDGPHGLIAGTTGAGKSELLRTLVASLASRLSPDHLVFVLVDYKGGSTFDACARLPHTVGLVTDLDGGLAERALVSLDAELRRREHLLRAHRAADLGAYRAIPGVASLPRLVVVIDEFAALAAELPDFLSALVGIAQRGRSLGVHLLLATQRPAGVVNDDIRANTSLRIALRLHDTADALDVVGVDGPATFPRGTPGRAMMRLGPDEHVVFQAARCTGPFVSAGTDRLRVVGHHAAEHGADVAVTAAAASELEVLVASIDEAARRAGVAPPHRPWLEALPTRLDDGHGRSGDDPTVLGVVDVPAEQARVALRWDRVRGNVALVGALGSGTTTALRTIAASFVAERRPADGHLYVIDGRGDATLDALAELDHCAAVVRLHERERLARLLARLDGEIASRAARPAGERGPDVVVLVDGLGQVRGSLDDFSTATELEQLERIVADGPSVGVVTAFTVEVPTAIPATLLMRCAERWLFHLDDAAGAMGVGVAAHRVPAAIPGRIVVASCGLDAQLALPGALVPRHGPGGPAPVVVLAPVVDAHHVEAVHRRIRPASSAAGDTSIVLGLHGTDLAPAILDVADGEHVAVIGPVRSGRSTALARVVSSWRRANERGRVVVACPDRRSPLMQLAERSDLRVEVRADLDDVDFPVADHRPCLVVVDDAEKIDDPTGRIAALCASRRPGLLVAVSLRPDAARAAYGHWTSVVRRSRLGVMLSGCDEHDGDLLGVALPRRSTIAPRPGLGWLVGGQPGLVQIAVDAQPGRSVDGFDAYDGFDGRRR